METSAANRARLEEAYAPTRRFAGVVAPPEIEPDDLVQEAMVRALRRGLDDIDDLGAYLRKIVLNLATSARRSFARRQSILRRVGPTETTVSLETPLLSELMRLPADDRALLWMVEIEGRSYAEVGELLGCADAAARTRAARARKRLRVELIAEEVGR
jgi:RNA polymerase sigma-70 factor (ECF subfamily)